jgi:putative N6-adenine-specific DNA methylase
MIADELRIIGSTQTNVVMAAELSRIARRVLSRRPPEPRKEGLGQLVFPFDRELAWAAVTYLRTPTRVVWDVFRSRADRLEPLYDELVADVRGDRRPLFRDGDGISVEARRTSAFAAGERQIVGTVKNALVDAAAHRGVRLHVDPDRPATQWVVRLDDRGELVVSLDLGGGSLSQRGWRRDTGEAPLREHLAAVLLMLCRFDPRADVLVDPMCGSGTIPIEAVLAARATPRPTPALAALAITAPGGGRPAPLFPDAAPLVIGCDLDLDVLAAARDNSRAAGVADHVVWQRADATALAPETIADIARERGFAAPTSGVLIANPPYGERLDEHDLLGLYSALAENYRRFRGWRAGFLVGNALLEQAFMRVLGRPRIKKPLANANLRAYFYLYDL